MASRLPTRSPVLLTRFCLTCCLVAIASVNCYGQDAPAAKRFRYWTTSWSFQEIDLRDLAGKLSSIGVELPIELSGTASVNFDVSIPLNGLKDSKAYKFRGSLSSPRLKADKLVLEKFAANVTYSEGIIRLVDLRGSQKNGSFEGTATADVANQGPFQASLKLRQLQLGPIAELLVKLGVGSKDQLATGLVDGQIDVSGTLSKIKDIASWKAKGNLGLGNIVVGQSIPYSITIPDLVLADGRLVVPSVGIQSSALSEFLLRADLDVQLTGTGKFAIALQADDIPATDLIGLYFDSPESMLSGKLDLNGNATGEMSPKDSTSPKVEIQLALASPSLRVFGVDLGLLEHRLSLTSDKVSLQPLQASDVRQPLTIESIDANYRIEPNRFQVNDLAAKLFGGTIDGSAELSRVADGTHRLDVAWKDLAPNVELPIGLGLRLSAETTGKVQWSLPADKIEFPVFHRVDAAIKVDPLKLGNESLGSVDATLKIDDAGFDLRGQGQMFGGRVELTSTSPLDPTVRWTDVPKLMTGAQLLLSNVSIDRMIQALARKNPRRFTGQISGKTELTNQADGIESRSRWVVRNFGVDRQSLSRRLDIDVSTGGTEIRVRAIHGNYARGQIQARGKWSLGDGPRVIDARIVHADGDRLLLPLDASANQWVGGKVSGRATMSGHGQGPLDDIHIRGDVRLNDGQTFDIPVGDARSPFRVLVKTSPLVWQADFSDVRSELAQGQVHGELHFASSGASRQGFKMDSRWRLNHVEFERLLKTYAGTRTVGRGVVTGGFVVSGRDIRSLNDLKGEFRMSFGGTDVSAVPGLSKTSALMGVASLAQSEFSTGEAVGRISRGAVAFERLVLLSDRLKVISTGQVALQGGRLNMKTIATTGDFTGQNQLIEGIAPDAKLSISFLSSINRWASDRTVVVDMVGTLRSPQIQLRPTETLQANVRQFLVRQLKGRLAIEAAVLNTKW